METGQPAPQLLRAWWWATAIATSRSGVKPLGFNFERNFNGIPGAVRARASLAPAHAARLALSGLADHRACARAAQDYWVAPASNDTIDQVAKLFDECGWKVTVYDGAE